MAKFPFTEDEVKAIHGAAHQVWREIAFDIFTAMADEWNFEHKKQKSVDDIRVSRDIVIELILDASRLDDALRSSLGKEKGNELAKKISHVENRHVMKIMREAFPYSHYGT